MSKLPPVSKRRTVSNRGEGERRRAGEAEERVDGAYIPCGV